MHELSESGFSPVFPIYIKDMLPVSKGLARGKVYPLNRIDRLAPAVKILFGNKNRVSVRQFLKFLPGTEIFDIQHAGMVPRPVRVSALILALDFQIVLFPG